MASPLGYSGRGRPAVEPAAGCESQTAAGSLVLRRMDRRGHKRGLVRAKKHGTKSGTGWARPRTFPGAFFMLTRTRPQPGDSGSLVHQRVRAVRVIQFDAHDRR